LITNIVEKSEYLKLFSEVAILFDNNDIILKVIMIFTMV